MSYKSPIEIKLGQLRLEQEAGVYKAVRQCDISVDKDELLKALRYDRDQYLRGYEDGLKHNGWISVAVDLPRESGKYIVYSSTGNVYQTKFYTYPESIGGHWGQKDKGKNITHWRTLPDPPEAEK